MELQLGCYSNITSMNGATNSYLGAIAVISDSTCVTSTVCLFVHSQDRKRHCDGGLKQAVNGSIDGSNLPVGDDRGAAARWANGGFTTAAKRVAAGGGHRNSGHQQHGDDPIEIDDDSDSQQQDHAQPGAMQGALRHPVQLVWTWSS